MKLKFKTSIYGIIFSIFSVFGFVLFYLYPFIISLIKSVLTSTNQYVLLLSSQTFKLAITNTFKFILIGIPILYIVSLLTAVAMNRLFKCKVKGSGLILTFHVLPMLIPSSVVAFFIQVFFGKYGVINGIFNHMNMKTVDWLNSPKVFMVLLVIYIWKNYGYCMIILMGGIESIPIESIEAARIEGANGLTILRKIILPQIKSYSIFAGMIGIIGIFRVFRESYMLFGNYPDSSIYMIQNFMNNCFYSLNYNRLAAASTIMVAVFTIIVLAFLYRDNEWRRKI